MICQNGLVNVCFIRLLEIFLWYNSLFTFLIAAEEEFEDTKGVNSIRKSKQNRQHNGQVKK
jgi:hypothetical protein